MRVLVIDPGASYSTADVATGVRYGLQCQGVDVVRYRLDARIERSQRWLYAQWRQAKRKQANLEKPNTADVFYQAGIGALEMALRHQVDVVLVVSAMFLHPDVIMLMKRARLRVAVLFTETPYDLQKELDVARHIDACWTNERSALRAFRDACPLAGYMPHGWHPDRHRPAAAADETTMPAHDVVFVGSAFRERVEWLSAIDWTGIDFALFGSWDLLGKGHPLRQFVKGGVLDNVQTAALYRRAKVGLNLYRTSKGFGKNAPQITHAESLNPRAYELAACGAFHLSTFRAEVRDVFGELVPTFETPAEASALLRQWLADDAGRARVAAALPGCVESASWVQRAACMKADLDILLRPKVAEPSHPLHAVGADR